MTCTVKSKSAQGYLQGRHHELIDRNLFPFFLSRFLHLIIILSITRRMPHLERNCLSFWIISVHIDFHWISAALDNLSPHIFSLDQCCSFWVLVFLHVVYCMYVTLLWRRVCLLGWLPICFWIKHSLQENIRWEDFSNVISPITHNMNIGLWWFFFNRSIGCIFWMYALLHRVVYYHLYTS